MRCRDLVLGVLAVTFGLGCGGESSPATTLNTEADAFIGAGIVEGGETADEDVSTGGDASGQAPEDAGTSDDTEVEPGVELCGNAVDDDGDGLIDCDDGDCLEILSECTHEMTCDDGLDGDSDGLIDCGDDDCFLQCAAVGCHHFSICLVETGCGCTWGYDCPESDAELGGCYFSCINSSSCTGVCEELVGPDVYTAVFELDACLDEHCAGLQAEARQACMVENCLEETGECYHGGDGSCSDVYFECMPQCEEDPVCQGICSYELSSDGFVDGVMWDACWRDLCDGDGDGIPDDGVCGVLAYFACAAAAPGCMENNYQETGLLCAEVFQSATECLGGDAWPCMEKVLGSQQLDQQGVISALFHCATAACMETQGAVSGACLADAAKGTCFAERTACHLASGLAASGETCGTDEECASGVCHPAYGGAVCTQPCGEECPDGLLCVPALMKEGVVESLCLVGAVEVCGTGSDEDGNGAFDCADVACAGGEACIATNDYKFIRIQDVDATALECAPINTEAGAAPGADVDAILLTTGEGAVSTAGPLALSGTGICFPNPNADASAAEGVPDGLFVSLNGRVLTAGHPQGATFQSGDVLSIYEVASGGTDSYSVILATEPFAGNEVMLGTATGNSSWTIP